jgi:hypothetical protein
MGQRRKARKQQTNKELREEGRKQELRNRKAK